MLPRYNTNTKSVELEIWAKKKKEALYESAQNLVSCMYNYTFYYLHEAESFLRSCNWLASLEILQLIWNLYVHYHVHKSLPLYPIIITLHLKKFNSFLQWQYFNPM
jgi:hypothetical protein